MAENYNAEMEGLMAGLSEGTRPRLLLQVCCAPCASAVLERLCPRFDVTAFFYDPNIRPEDEYEKRLAWLRYLLENLPCAEGVELLERGWDGEAFSRAATGLEAEPEGGRRCEACFALRLGETARLAREGGYDFFCTTLTVSPHKDAALINRIGAELAEKHGVSWLPSDFKKRDGYLRSIRLSRELGLYRQSYCGCGF